MYHYEVYKCSSCCKLGVGGGEGKVYIIGMALEWVWLVQELLEFLQLVSHSSIILWCGHKGSVVGPGGLLVMAPGGARESACNGPWWGWGQGPRSQCHYESSFICSL